MIPLLIVDDESIIRGTIAAMVRRKYPEQFHIFLASNGREALSLVASESVELVLADIKMPVMDGLQLLHCLHEQQLQCDVIFISGFDDYSFVREAMKSGAVDYLLKPIPFDRFLKAVNRVHELLQKEQESTPEPYLFVKTDKLLKKVTIQDILFIESMGNYVLIHTSSSKEITYSPLKSLLEFLPDNLFIQVHRSYIVQTSKVQAIEGNMLIIGTHKIPIARNLRDEVLNALLKDKLISR